MHYHFRTQLIESSIGLSIAECFQQILSPNSPFLRNEMSGSDVLQLENGLSAFQFGDQEIDQDEEEIEEEGNNE